MNHEPNPSLSYRDAGVDIDAGNALVERIKPAVARTRRPEVLGGLGGFGALFELPPGRWRHPVLVSGTDGVGTKLKLAQQLDRHDGIGIDLVGMCVNDVLVQGAEPLFFLDYFACGRLSVDTAATVVGSIARGCELAGCALVGGETAEMPGMYEDGEYDLAGFCVGAVEKSALNDGSRIAAGDVLLGVSSSGAHSNGYSLIRRILARDPDALDRELDGARLADLLMSPTRIYVRPVLDLLAAGVAIHGMAHITGGGLTENIIRVVPPGLGLRIDPMAWSRPALFDWLQRTGNVTDTEMWRTFNCGIGYVLLLPGHAVTAARGRLAEEGWACWEIGAVEDAAGGDRLRFA
ncbi:MAG: phosphoribosylformylglycinamidine cyclo-ligase [Xanthomonadales bacterium]|nr:phosphoribosylformylglycinamidine cyclo-ligase [Xanthomonadales bacterium]